MADVNKIALGDIIAIKGQGIISALISAASGIVSHVGLVTAVGNDYGAIQVTQALSTVKTLSLAETLANAKFGYCLHNPNLSQDKRIQMANYALSRVGEQYAYRDILLQALKQITGSSKWTEYFDESSAKGVICSMLVAEAYLIGDCPLSVSPKDCTPSDCVDDAFNRGWTVQPL